MAARTPSARSFFADPVGFAAAHPEPIVELGAATGDAALVADPDEAWRILVTDAGRFRQGKWKRRARRFYGPTLNTLDGGEHRERRILLQPALDRRRILASAARVNERVERLQSTWREGDEIGLRALLDPLCVVLAGDMVLGTDLEDQAERLAADLAIVMRTMPRLLPPLPGTERQRALRRVHATVRTRLRVDGLPTGTETLLALLRASGLPERVSVGEVTAFLLAAADEPPSGLAAAWWLLGRDEERDRRLHAELTATDRESDELPYRDAVLAEALRLLPPARHIDRCPAAAEPICGRTISEGTNVLVSPLVLQHDPRFWDDPAAFVPERWLDAPSRSRPRGAYLPFGAGPHTCIGEAFARLVMEVTLAVVARRWRLRPVGEQRPPVPGAPDLRFVLERR